MLEYLGGYTDATVTEATVHPVAAEYPHSTLNGTQTCSSHISTALYETYLAGQEESAFVGGNSEAIYSFMYKGNSTHVHVHNAHTMLI